MASLRQRWSTPASPSHAERRPGPIPDRLLRALGVEPEFAEALLGDLVEELAVRKREDGTVAAHLWYAAEAMRSVPHILGSIASYAQPARLAALGAATAVLFALSLAALSNRDGRPARLVVDEGQIAGRVVVNSLRATQLAVQVRDAAGHRLVSHDVHFAWESGAPLSVSQQGFVTCTARSDATVRASLGAVTTKIAVSCRPVRQLRSSTSIALIAGQQGRELPVSATGDDGRPVHELRGLARVIDSSVAMISGARIHPRGVGETMVALGVGNLTTEFHVVVYEPVPAFTGLRPDQRYVAVPVRVRRDQSLRWPLPEGGFWLEYLPRHEGAAPPTIVVSGPVDCTDIDVFDAYRLPEDEHGISCTVLGPGASVTLSHGRTGLAVVEGDLAMDRERAPFRTP